MTTIPVYRTWGGVSGAVAELCRKIAETLDLLANGHSRTVGTVTLTANDTTTTVMSRHVTPTSHITLTPLTANAAAEDWYISARTSGTSFVIAHGNDADADKEFTFEVRNG